jgi:hypothetical protein
MSNFSSTNPNSFGGSFNYDSRTGLGIGSLSGGPGKGIGSNWNMGDALSSPKGQWDNEEIDSEKLKTKKYKINSQTSIKDLALYAGLIGNEESDFNEFEADIESKAHTSYQRRASDSLAKKGADISSLGGLGNSIAGVIGLSAGHKIQGNTLMENDLKDYIKEVILSEKYMSGSIAVRSSGKGSMYKNAMASTNTANASPHGHLPTGRHGINKGYGQKKVKVKIKGSTPESDIEIDMTPTTTGAETINTPLSKFNYNSLENGKLSSFEILNATSEQEFLDNLRAGIIKQI